MSTPTTNASVTTSPGGTGNTITPTLPTHAAGDIIEIFVVNSGVTGWSAPAGWTTKQQQASSGNASTGVIGTLLYRRVLSGDTLPLASPVCSLGATVTRSAVALTKRGADLEGVHTLPEWLAFGSTAGTSNPVRPPPVTTHSPENLVHIYYGQRGATTAPEQTSYTQVQQVIISGTIVNNVSERNVADQNTVLSNQDASPTSGARWIAMISCTPSPDYPYYRAGSQALTAAGTSATPALPAGTTASDNRGNRDLIVATVECAGTPTIAPNTPADWTIIDEWSNTTSGGGTTVRKYRTLYDGSLDRQFNRSTSGEIFVYFSTYHNAHQSIPIGTSAVQQNASSTTSTFPALSRTGTKTTVQATCVADGTPTFTAPSGWTERNDSQGVTCADQSFDAKASTASASFTLSSASPTLAGLMEVFSVASSITTSVTPATATLTTASFAPTVTLRVTPSVVGLTLAAFAPTIKLSVTPSTRSLAITAFAPMLRLTATPSTVALSTTQFAPLVAIGVIPASAVLTVSTFAPTLLTQLSITPDPATLTITSRLATIIIPGVFPTTAVLDDFDRASEGPPPSASWSGSIDGGAGLQVGTGSDVHSATANTLGSAAWDETFGPNCEAYLTIKATTPNATAFGLLLRLTDLGASFNGYAVQGGNTSDLTVVRFDAGVPTTLDTLDIGTALVSGESVGASMVGNALSVYVKRLGEVWTLVDTVEDSTYATAGAIGLQARRPVVGGVGERLDDFGGGDAVLADITVTPPTRALSLTTFAPTLKTQLTPATRALTLTTFAAVVTTRLTPNTVLLVLSALAVKLAETLTPPTRSLTLTTFTASLRTTITPATAPLTLTSFAASLRTTVRVTPASAALTLTTASPSLALALTPTSRPLTLTTFAPSLGASVSVTPASATLVTSSQAARPSIALTPSTRVLTISTFTPTVSLRVTPATRVLTLTTLAPSLHLRETPATAALATTRFAPLLRLGVKPANATGALATFAPTVEVTSGMTVTPAVLALAVTRFSPTLHLRLTPAVGGHVLVALAPTVSVGTRLTPTTATLTTVGLAVALRLNIQPVHATLTITELTPTVIATGIIPAPQYTYMVESGNYEVEVEPGIYECMVDTYAYEEEVELLLV